MRVLLIALLALAGIAPASAADLKILTAGAFKSAAQELAAEFEKKTGHKVTVENDTASPNRTINRIIGGTRPGKIRGGYTIRVKSCGSLNFPVHGRQASGFRSQPC